VEDSKQCNPTSNNEKRAYLAESTLPRKSSSTSSGLTPDFAMAALMAWEPNSTAEREEIELAIG